MIRKIVRMDIQRIEEASHSQKTGSLKFNKTGLRCICYAEETCAAPKIRFSICRTCYMINPKYAARTLFDRIKMLAVNIFNLQATGSGQSLHR